MFITILHHSFSKLCLLVTEVWERKSCLMITYSTGSFPSEYVPTVFYSNSVSVVFGGKHYQLALWDSAGQVINRSVLF